jgi:hypothetical protein
MYEILTICENNTSVEAETKNEALRLLPCFIKLNHNIQTIVRCLVSVYIIQYVF